MTAITHFVEVKISIYEPYQIVATVHTENIEPVITLAQTIKRRFGEAAHWRIRTQTVTNDVTEIAT